jgi:hypothetical protein
MNINRKFKDDSHKEVEVVFKLSDDEVIESIVGLTIDERVVFFRKLFQTDVKNILTLKFLKQFI